MNVPAADKLCNHHYLFAKQTLPYIVSRVQDTRSSVSWAVNEIMDSATYMYMKQLVASLLHSPEVYSSLSLLTSSVDGELGEEGVRGVDAPSSWPLPPDSLPESSLLFPLEEGELSPTELVSVWFTVG